METTRFLVWALLMAALSGAFQLALATGHLQSYEWAIPYLWASAFGLFLSWLVLTIHRKSTPPTTQEIPSPPAPILRDINVDARPHQEQHVHIGSDFFQQPEPPPPKSAPVVTPLLEVIDDKPILIAYNGGEWYEEDPSNPHLISNKLNAHIIVFRKKPAIPGESSPPLLRVTAHLMFRGKAGSQLVIDFGTWLREYTHYVDFVRAESHALVLSSGVKANGKVDENVYALDNPHHTDPRRARFRSGITVLNATTEKPLMDNCSEVEIVLVAGQITVYHDTFEFSLDPEGTMKGFGPAS